MLRGWRLRLVPAAAVVACGAAAAPAHALTLSADTPETGWIRLQAAGADGATVEVAEQLVDRQQPIAQVRLAGGRAVVKRAAIWRCDRLERHFVATASNPDGSTETATANLRTPSCGKRLDITATRVQHGLFVRVVDRWGVGDVTGRVCVAAPGRAASCRPASIVSGRSQASLTFRGRDAGFWTASLDTPWGQRAARAVYVRPAHALRVLATGDSMIEYVDSSLKDRLGKRAATVQSDPRVSTGLSKPFLVNWPRLARKQAAGIRPDLTVVFIGANDGFPFGNVQCCGAAWVEQYSARAKQMMKAYSRGGRGLVYWLTLPAPRPAQWRAIYPAVNRALKRAAAEMRGLVRLIDLATVFTPGGRFRESMVWRGKRTTVRQPDGVHLSPAGAGIAESLVESALRQDSAR